MSRGGAGRPRAGCCKACEERDAPGKTQWGKCHGKEETTGREFDLGKQTIHSLLADKHQGYLGAWGLPPTQNGTFVYPRRCLQTQPGKSWRHPEPVASHSALISNSECQGALRLGRQRPRHLALRANKNSFGARGTGFLGLSSGGPAAAQPHVRYKYIMNQEAPQKHP